MNENLKKKLIEYTAENAFVQACGIEVWELEEDHAVMGTTARPIYAVVAVAAIAGGLQAMGAKGIDVGAGVAAPSVRCHP